MKTVVLFGGSGFIGSHLAQHLLKNALAEKIFLVDIKEPRETPYLELLRRGLESGKVVFAAHDVREPIPAGLVPGGAEVIINLAAVHREPGHAAREYFETNLAGAENVCAWATAVGCMEIIFTSSISPYGPCEEITTEASFPAPETAYGSSKLAAEKIHLGWQSAEAGRRLLILRPGVVFGAGEGGNVTRLVHSVVKWYYVYLGNRKTIKAAGYVKELCGVAMFGLEAMQKEGRNAMVLNFTMDPPPTIEEMVEAVRKVAGVSRRPIGVPVGLLLVLAYPLGALERVFRFNKADQCGSNQEADSVEQCERGEAEPAGLTVRVYAGVGVARLEG
jgi:nucleoside-diphosphate-sugar epimerase